MQVIKAGAGIVKQQAVREEMLDKRPPVTTPPENQYVAAGHRCSFSLTPVDHMKPPFISSPERRRQLQARDTKNLMQMSTAAFRGLLLFIYLFA